MPFIPIPGQLKTALFQRFHPCQIIFIESQAPDMRVFTSNSSNYDVEVHETLEHKFTFSTHSFPKQFSAANHRDFDKQTSPSLSCLSTCEPCCRSQYPLTFASSPFPQPQTIHNHNAALKYPLLSTQISGPNATAVVIQDKWPCCSPALGQHLIPRFVLSIKHIFFALLSKKKVHTF